MIVAGADENPAPAQPALSRNLGFQDLPEEVQKDVFAQCSQGDLICLCLVSKRFREIAAGQLYRNFHIVFPDEDDPAYDSPIDGLAGGLDTFVTSDYDYGKHLRDLSLDTLSAGDKAEAAYKHYLYSVSCGKFMNTLLLLTLRKAKALETFKWNIRVELSRPVYKALHNIKTLRNLHVRFQSGPSLYETPPPLPYSAASYSPTPSASSIHLPDVGPPPPPQPQMSLFGIPAPPSMMYTNPLSSALISGPPPPIPKPSLRAAKVKKAAVSKEPPTFSGFKKLKSLAVLDMDTLEAITEVKQSIRNSSSTLTKLKISFSDQLGLQARKPQPETELDDSDQDDEFQVVPGPPHPAPYSDGSLSLPARTFRAAEERKSQEAVLGRLFDVEPYLVKKSSSRIPLKEKENSESPDTHTGDKEGGDDGDATPTKEKEFLNSIKQAASQILRSRDMESSELSASKEEILDTLLNAARKYIDAHSDKADPNITKGQSDGESSATGEASGNKTNVDDEATPTAQSETSPTPTSIAANPEAGAADTKPSDSSATAPKEAAPEDISIEEPEEQLSLDGQETPCVIASVPPETSISLSATPKITVASSSGSTTPNATPSVTTNGSADSPGLGKAMANMAAQKSLMDQDRIADAGLQIRELDQSISDIEQGMRSVVAEMADAKKEAELAAKESSGADADAQDRRISEYIRATRGLGLESLSIYLVPVRASVLSKAIDLRVLRRLTLLNVGAQGPIWALLAKENKTAPLPLRKIFTDNVTPAFLTFVNQLEELHEFFILEREAKYKPEPFATQTSTTNDQIRRLVLRKHLPTLKRLMIKNLGSQDWDVDEQTTRLICRKGKVLEELAVSMNIRAVHTLMQNISGLSELHALHIIQLRNDDTCVWVMRETKKFLIDNLSHHPEMKLEWISIDDDDRLEKIIRIPSEPKKSKKAAGKETEKTQINANADAGVFPILPTLDSWDASGLGSGAAGDCSEDDSESDSDEDEEGGGRQRVRLETLENVHFYDVWGVRIFKKEVVTGRL